MNLNKTHLISLKEASNKLNLDYETLRRKCTEKSNLEGVYKVDRAWRVDFDLFKTNFIKSTILKRPSNFNKLSYYFLNDCSYFSTIKQHGVVSIKGFFKNYAIPYFSKNDFTKVNLYKFINLLRAKNLSDQTIKKFFTYLSVMCEECIKVGLLEDNIAKSLFKAKDNNRIVFLNKEERKKLLFYCDEDLGEHVEFAIETGLRKGEQTNLTWNDIDFTTKQLYVRHAKYDKSRYVPLSPLALYILNKRKQQLLEKPFKEIYHYQYNRIYNLAGFKDDEGYCWHTFRHTFATWALKGWHSWQNNKPAPIYTVKVWMGHSSIKITERYVHLDVSDCMALVDYSSPVISNIV